MRAGRLVRAATSSYLPIPGRKARPSASPAERRLREEAAREGALSSGLCIDPGVTSPTRAPVPKYLVDYASVCPFTGRGLDARHPYYISYKALLECAENHGSTSHLGEV